MTGLPAAALALLTAWLPDDDEPDRPQMQLATVDEHGAPDVRTVLLSTWSAEGFSFHTDSASRKAAQLTADPRAALLMLWPGFSRQLVVRGHAEPESAEAVSRAWGRRSPYLQQLAWQNTAELAALDVISRRAAWSGSTSAPFDQAPTWTGYLLRPASLTFWEPDPQGPSHRVEYRRAAEGRWSEHHLPG